MADYDDNLDVTSRYQTIINKFILIGMKTMGNLRYVFSGCFPTMLSSIFSNGWDDDGSFADNLCHGHC